MTTHHERFPVRSPEHDTVTQTEDQDDLYTATQWTLHLRVPTPFDVKPTIARVMKTGAECLMGGFLGGDSFAEWCEPYGAQDWYFEHGVAVHIYFVAHDLERAKRTGKALAAAAGLHSAVDAVISTAGDWAEQAEILHVIPWGTPRWDPGVFSQTYPHGEDWGVVGAQLPMGGEQHINVFRHLYWTGGAHS